MTAQSLSMAQLELQILDWARHQPGVVSIKVARVDGEDTCRVGLDVHPDRRREVHDAFCALERRLIDQIDRFDLDWMTFSLNEYPLTRKAFFARCKVPNDGDCGLTVFPNRLINAEQRKQWNNLVFESE